MWLRANAAIALDTVPIRSNLRKLLAHSTWMIEGQLMVVSPDVYPRTHLPSSKSTKEETRADESTTITIRVRL